MAVLIGVCLGFLMSSNFWNTGQSRVARNHSNAMPACADDVHLADNALVVYSFFDGDEVSWGNLMFFLDQGVSAGDGAKYVIVLNGMASLDDARLPRLPPNARYVLHENECYDWGTYTWVLEEVVDPSNYKCTLNLMCVDHEAITTQQFQDRDDCRHDGTQHRRLQVSFASLSSNYYYSADILFINSSVRGPLLPWHAARQHWTRMFTQKLNDHVKLVGPAISCEHFCLMEKTENSNAMRRKECRKNAHVQSVAVATDQVGLQVLKSSGYVLRCHRDRFEAVFYGEIGASLAIFEAGYTIDSFLTRYQGVDWRDQHNWECNHALSPIGKRTFDGVTVSALEAVFPKLKGSLLESGLQSHFEALKMSEWMSYKAAARNITGNWFVTDGDYALAEDMIIAERKGQECFDWPYYKKKNPDVANLSRQRIWRHFLTRGAVEFREHRWKCSLKSDDILKSLPK